MRSGVSIQRQGRRGRGYRVCGLLGWEPLLGELVLVLSCHTAYHA